jgi:hypothetical protein
MDAPGALRFIRRPFLDMDAEKTCDHDYHDHHADDVEDIHCISPKLWRHWPPAKGTDRFSFRLAITATIVNERGSGPDIAAHSPRPWPMIRKIAPRPEQPITARQRTRPVGLRPAAHACDRRGGHENAVHNMPPRFAAVAPM